MLFGTVATLSAVSLCYPNEAVEIGQASWRFTKDQAQAAIGSRIPGMSLDTHTSLSCVETRNLLVLE